MVPLTTLSTHNFDATPAPLMLQTLQEKAKPVKLEPSDAVIANHTAEKLGGDLNNAYLVQSIRTGLPLMLVDLVVTTWSLFIVSYLVNLSQGNPFNPGTWLQLPAILFFQVGLISLHQLYPGAGISPVYELRGIVRSTALAFLCLSAINLIFGKLPRIEFAVFVCTAILVSMALPFARHCAREFLSRTRWWGIRTLLIGSSRDCSRLCARIQSRRTAGFVLVGYVTRQQDLAADDDETHRLGHAENAFEVGCHYRAPVAALVSSEIHHFAHRLMFQFPSLVWMGNSTTAQDSSDLLGAFTKRLNMPFLRLMPRLCKRALDLAICIPGLIVLAPFLAAIAIAIKVCSPGPVIYGSSRVGQHGRKFKMWKFRSMVPNADEALRERLASDPEAKAEWDRDSKLKNDPRIIAGIGHLLRRWSLDEFPQLWNVLMGEMSLVGPRPVPPGEIVRYQNHYYEYTQMWPGMTGLWQVSGRNETSFDTRVFLVHHYAANWSLWLDAWILVKTPITVLARRGAY